MRRASPAHSLADRYVVGQLTPVPSSGVPKASLYLTVDPGQRSVCFVKFGTGLIADVICCCPITSRVLLTEIQGGM